MTFALPCNRKLSFAKSFITTLLLLLLCMNLSAQNNTCVNITGFKILNEELPLDSILLLKKIKLSPDQNSFSISFASADQITKDSSLFYKLNGADKNWIRAGRAATINYKLLPPGRYDFMLKCSKHKEMTALEIVVKIPFWLSTWFIILCCAIFIGFAYCLHVLSLKRLMALETLRQKVSRDLHDDVGSTLSTINILSLMAKAKLTEDPVKASEYISKISDNSSRMMEAMNDIVWSINPMNDSMQKILARMREFATEALESKDIEMQFHFSPDASEMVLNMEQRRDIFLIFKEAINNIAKYADATKVIVELTIKNHLLSLIVKDNGKGFDVENADSGNGLNNMQKRAEKLKAKFAIVSQPNAGTTIMFEMRIT
jgi:signal transduction histidine kinase